jgi:hypothetical protein
MTAHTHVSRILLYEVIGFLVIIVLSWIDDITDLSHFVGSTQSIHNWRQSILGTLMVLLVAIPVMILTRRLVSRLYYLEGFLRVCAWCKKLDHNGEWIPLSEFFERKFQTETSHAICLTCRDDMKATLRMPNRG